MLNDKPIRELEHVFLPENHHIVRWLRPLLHAQLGRQDVFVPVGETVETLSEPKVAAYFTVPSEHWSVLCVRGSALSQQDVDVRRARLENQVDRATTKEARTSAKAALKKLKSQERRGLVTPEELLAQRHAFRDDFGVREAWGKFRVYRSHPSGVNELAALLEETGFRVVPVLPAFSWRNVEFPREDVRYQVPMAHAQTRTPCPWSKQSLERRLFVHR